MALGWKVVVDCRDARAQADFWAAVLGSDVEDPSPLIDRLLAAGHLPPEAVLDRDGRRTFAGLAGIRHPDDPFDPASGVGSGRRLLFQEVPEAKTGKNRLHLDVHGEPGALEETVARVEALGASRVREVDEGPAGHWWVLQDPEGNEFCVA